VSWHDRSEIRLRGVDAGRTHSLERAPRSETAAIGYRDECVVAWSDGNTKYASLSGFERCLL
jgi:hypothetical protein